MRSAVSLHFLICVMATTASLKYFNNDGLVIDKPLEKRNFLGVFEYQKTKIYIKSMEHMYWTNLQMFEDPCNNKITGLFNKARGSYNVCDDRLEFIYKGLYYNMDVLKHVDNIVVSPADEAPEKFKQIKKNADSSSSNDLNLENSKNSKDGFDELFYMHDCATGENKHDIMKNSVISEVTAEQKVNGINLKSELSESKEDENRSKNTLIESEHFSLNLFIFNDIFRVQRLGDEIVKNTNKIIDEVNLIFQNSKIQLKIENTGILNFKKNYFTENTTDSLTKFKNLIELTRFHHLNLKLPLAKCDLVMLLAELPIKHNETDTKNLLIHGKTYMGGSTRLDSSYSIVYTSPGDSIDFIAKKIAHEIGHSLNAVHVDSESIMEKTTCKTCNDSKRLFSEASVDQINHFLNKNSRIFRINQNKKYKDDEILKNRKEANDYVNERRKHSFLDIVKSRLQNRQPDMNGFGSSPFLMIGLYFLSILVLIYYWAKSNEMNVNTYR